MIKTTFQKNAFQKNRIIQSLLGAIAIANLGTIAQPAQGHDTEVNPNTCAFEIEISAGTLEGNRFYGTFTFDPHQLTGEGE
ncbi:MAG: hypothetical protein AAGA67_10995, partial [Cyanobacteria bacterium P01_F01_bin.153]